MQLRRTSNTTRHSVRDYPLTVWLLGIGCFLNVGGLSLLWPVNAIYIHSVLHQPLTVASLVLMVYSGAGFIGSYVGGRLYDALGATPVLVAGLVLSAILILIPVATADWYTYIAVMALFGATCAIPFPVLNAMAGHAWPEGGRRAFNFLYVANNLGVAAGTAVGGVLAQWSFDTVFIGICAAYLLFVLLVVGVLRKPFARISEVRRQHAAAADDQVSMAVQPRVPWVPVVVMFIGYVSAWMVYVQWQSTISVYMKAIGYPLTMYSVLWTLNGLLIFALQPLISRIVARWSSLSAHMIAGTLLYAVAFGLLIRGNQYPMFVAAMVVTTVGELFVWPAVPAAIAVLAPDNRLGTLQGLVASCATLGRMIGPVIGGVLYDHTAMANVLVVMCCATVLPAACFIGFGWLNRRGLSASGVPHSS